MKLFNLRFIYLAVKKCSPFHWRLLTASVNANEANIPRREAKPPSVQDDTDDPTFD